MQYGTRNGAHDISFFYQELVMFIWSGNHDLFKHIFGHFLCVGSTKSTKSTLAELISDSIIFQQREIFEFLLEQGVDINQPGLGINEYYPIFSLCSGFRSRSVLFRPTNRTRYQSEFDGRSRSHSHGRVDMSSIWSKGYCPVRSASKIYKSSYRMSLKYRTRSNIVA
jgi:hypothetical protein